MLSLRGWLCSRCGSKTPRPRTCRNGRRKLSRSLTGVLVSMDTYSTRQRATPSWAARKTRRARDSSSSSEPPSPSADPRHKADRKRRFVPLSDESVSPSPKRSFFRGERSHGSSYARGFGMSSGGESDSEQHVYAARRKRGVSRTECYSDASSATNSDSEATAPASTKPLLQLPTPFAFPIEEDVEEAHDASVGPLA